MEGAMSGALLENYTVAEIIKTYQNAGQEPFLYYYRDKDAREIDLILEQDGKLFPIEIKKMASPPKKLTKVFDLIDKSPLQRGTGAIPVSYTHLAPLPWRGSDTISCPCPGSSGTVSIRWPPDHLQPSQIGVCRRQES